MSIPMFNISSGVEKIIHKVITLNGSKQMKNVTQTDANISTTCRRIFDWCLIERNEMEHELSEFDSDFESDVNLRAIKM